MKTLSIDIETFSDVQLPKTGVYRYCESPDFEILLFAYSVDAGPVEVVDLACGEKIPEAIIAALEDDTVIKWAFNASFERICLSRFLGYPTGEYLNPESWRCSMIWAATMGLPLSLEGVGTVLGLEKQKLTEGKDLIKYFCQPCAATKSNGGRTRNRPFHAPDKWEAFKRYNIRDVETEMGIQQKLHKFPVPDSVWEEYHIDQEINDRGVRLDMELVHQAIEMDSRSREELTAAMKDITALENPNSVQQMKQWLSDNGVETNSLDKKAVAELLKDAPDKLADVLTLRQQLAKSSVRKFQAMEKTVCEDGRARGMFQFYGANRTGRFSGRNIQLQNLPQNHLPDLSEARSLVRSGDFEGVKLLYEDVPDTLVNPFAGAFKLLYDNCEGFRNFIDGFLENVKNIISTAMETIKTVITTIWNAIKTAIDTVLTAIQTAFTTAWNAIKTAITTVVNAIKTVITTVLTAIQTTITTIVNAISTFLTTAWTAIQTTVTTIINAIKTVITTVWNAIKTTVSTVVNAIKTTISTVWNGIKNTITSIVNGIKTTVSNVFNNILSGIKTTVGNIA